MSRELRFRAWSQEYKRFFVPNIYHPEDNDDYQIETDYHGNARVVRRYLGEYDAELKNCIIQQYTGLKDCNKKEIFEGDLVKVRYKMDEHGDVEEHISEVVFENGAFGDKYDTFFDLFMLPNFSIEVVGNIFEK